MKNSEKQQNIIEQLNRLTMEQLNRITVKTYIPPTPIYKMIDGQMVQCGWQMNSILH
jgi:hypothetical protein